MAPITYRLYDYTQLSLYPPSNRYRMRFLLGDDEILRLFTDLITFQGVGMNITVLFYLFFDVHVF